MKKNVLITGVAKGIGKAIAVKFLSEGYCVHGTFFKDKEKAIELQNQYGDNAVQLYGPFDFRKTQEVQAFLEIVKDVELDSIVCSAGIFNENDDFNDFNLNIFNETMNCNFYAPLIITTGLRKNIKENGSIIIVSSNDAFSGAFSSMSYSISKSALISLMKCLCVNYGEKNVRVNSVAPGAIDTDMNTPEQMNIAPYFSPIARVGNPVDIANVVFFLASDAAGFISGENITIDGGYSIMSVLLKSEANSEFSKNIQMFIKTQNQNKKQG